MSVVAVCPLQVMVVMKVGEIAMSLVVLFAKFSLASELKIHDNAIPVSISTIMEHWRNIFKFN